MNYHDDIKAYLDGELPAARMEEMRLAIEADPALRAEADQFSSITGRIQDMAKLPPVHGLERALDRMKARPPWVTRNWTWAAPVVLFVAIAAVMTPLTSSPKMAAKREMAGNFANEATFDSPSAAAAPEVQNANPRGIRGDIREVEVSRAEGNGGPGGGSGGGAGAEGYGADSQGRGGAKAELANPSSSSPTLPQDEKSSGINFGFAGKAKAGEELVAESDVPVLDETMETREVIRDASVTVEVESALKAKDELKRIVEEAQGFIESSDLQADKEHAVAHVRAKVPVQEFSKVVEKAKGMGFVLADNETSQDVTLPLVDNKSRIGTYRTQEEQYRLMLSRAKTTGEILAIKEKLSHVRARIESLEAQGKKLKKLADLSTLNATFEQNAGAAPTGSSAHWADDSWTGAVGRFDAVWKVVATFLMNLLTLAPFWLPIAIFVWWYRVKGPKPA